MVFWDVVANVTRYEIGRLYDNECLVPLGIAMGVTGMESNAKNAAGTAWATIDKLEFRWPEGFVGTTSNQRLIGATAS